MARSDPSAHGTMNAGEALLEPALSRGLATAPAVIGGDRTVTYGELDAWAAQCGHAARELGIGRGDRVVMVLRDTPDFFAFYLGVLKIGAVPVALSVRATAAELRFVIEDSGCRLVVVDAELVSCLEAATARLAAAPALMVAGRAVGGHALLNDAVRGQPDRLHPEPMAADDMAFWMYTSGTTGPPKAAVHRQGAVLTADRFLGEVLGVGPGDRLFCSSKLFFAYALGHALFGVLRRGATAILYADWPTPEAVCEVVARHRPTILLSVPTFYRNLLRAGAAKEPALRAVRHFVSAGERLPEIVLERWRAAVGKPIVEAIGATEAGFLFLANDPDDVRVGSCGRPTPGTEVRLLDEDDRPVTEPDVPGVLWVRMDSIAGGYWRQPEKTAAAFRDGWYRTGDVFTVDADGRYRHQGRADDMLKISGQWVSPAEIEEHVLACPGVGAAAVVGVADGDGLTRLALFVTAPDEADTEALEARITEHLLGRLAVHKCPRRVRVLEDLPCTATGKVQRFRLREMARDLVGGMAALLLSATVAAQAAGPAQVLDAETLIVDGRRVCLAGIDAPEPGQRCTTRHGNAYDCHRVAAAGLKDLTAGATVRCRLTGAVRGGCPLATCTADGYDLSEGMTYTGWALADPETGGAYKRFEDTARRKGHGLWGGTFRRPWEVRRASGDLTPN